MTPALALRLGLLTATMGLLISAFFFFGRHVGTSEEAARYLREDKKAAAKVEATIVGAQAQDMASAADTVHRETIVREITREVPKVIDRPVYRNVCIDADGVRLIEWAVSATNVGEATASRFDGPSGAIQQSASRAQR